MDKILAIIAMALVTYGIRLGPFILFGGGKQTPEWVRYIGGVLPPAVMGMLIVYSLKHIEFLKISSSLPVLIAIAVTTPASVGCRPPLRKPIQTIRPRIRYRLVRMTRK